MAQSSDLPETSATPAAKAPQDEPLSACPPNDAPARRPRGPIDRGELRQLRQWSQNLSCALAGGWSRLSPTPLEAHCCGAQRTSLAEFGASLDGPGCCYLLLAGAGAAGSKPPSAAGWMEISPQLAAAMIELLLGGSCQQPPPPRALTAIERNLLRHVIAPAVEMLDCGAGRPRLSLAPEGQRARLPAEQSEQVMTALSLTVCLGPAGGTMRLCLPAEMMEGPCGEGGTEPSAAGTVELSAAVEDATTSPDDLRALGPGDVIVSGSPADGEVIIRVGGIPKFAGRLGSHNGRRAVKITRRLDEQAQDGSSCS